MNLTSPRVSFPLIPSRLQNLFVTKGSYGKQFCAVGMPSQSRQPMPMPTSRSKEPAKLCCATSKHHLGHAIRSSLLKQHDVFQ